ncbi:MAG: hypothetical protein HC794_01135 [Nitrospiraceae bacterium]|nr:hypothetical protein [Nitrospiraceae bacterium]
MTPFLVSSSRIKNFLPLTVSKWAPDTYSISRDCAWAITSRSGVRITKFMPRTEAMQALEELNLIAAKEIMLED